MYQSTTLVGYIAKDADSRYTPSGVPFCSFSLPINKKWNGADGQANESTIWYRVTVWRKLAETLAPYLIKGKQVIVVGELAEARIYTDRSGNPAVSLEFTANTIRLLSGNGGTGAANGHQEGEQVSDPPTEDIPF